MSLLNLNSPAGRGPRGKSSSRAWMGIGLVIAVLGIGSTFASNITLNQPGGTTEFGQGVTQTVYCGGDQSVTITPISTYQNTVIGAGTPAVDAGTFTARIVRSSSSSSNEVTTSVTPITIAASSNSSTTIPRFNDGSAKTGWWLNSPTSSSAISPQPSTAVVAASPNSYYFVAQYSSGKYRKASSSDNWDPSTVIFRNKTDKVDGEITDASFKIGGVVISKIPLSCDGVNFIVSSYAETGSAQTLISSGGVNVKEVAALWTGSGTVTVSRDRTAPVATTLVTGEQTGTSLKFIFNTGSGEALTTEDLYKLVVETQEDVLSDN